jgi:predicted P-loop ATPase
MSTLNGKTPAVIAALDSLPAQFALTPVRAKAPYLTNWQSIDTSRDAIAKDITSGKADGFGIKLGIPSGGICAIDIDGTAARCKLIDIMGDAEMPLTIEFASGKLDRSQYLFTIPPELWDNLKSKSDKIEGEEFGFFWDGRQSVLPPSAHPETDGYFWLQSPDDAPIAPIPDKLLEYWLNLINPPRTARSRPERPKSVVVVDLPNSTKTSVDVHAIPIERLLTKAHRSILSGTSQGGRNSTGTSLARDLIGVAAIDTIECDYRGKNYTLKIQGNPEDLFYSYCNGCSPPLSDSEGDTIWMSAQTSDHEPCIRDEEILKNCARSYLKELFPAPGRPKKEPTTVGTVKDKDYQAIGRKSGINLSDAGIDKHGIPLSKYMKLELDLFDLFGSRLEFNEMTREIELDRKLIDLNLAKSFVARSLEYDASTENCILALNAIATINKYHPVREYLASLKDQPKVNINNIPEIYWGNKDELQNKLFFKKLIASVARVMNPGLKDDSLLILQGKQGLGKSTALKALAGEDWFNDDLRSLEDKDELAKLSRFWILELAEVDYLFGKKEIELFKRFLSATEDTFRPPYGRANIRTKRSCSFFASTNKSEFLADPTGDRRYWVVEVGQNIDIKGLRRDRDLIWAAALDAYESGETWWLEGDEMKTHATANETWRDEDPWGDPILNKLDVILQRTGSIEYVKVQEIMDRILDIPLERQDKRTRNRIGATLQMQGFTLKPIRIDGKLVKVWTRGFVTQVSQVDRLGNNLSNSTENHAMPQLEIDCYSSYLSYPSSTIMENKLINSDVDSEENKLINPNPELINLKKTLSENWVTTSNLGNNGVNPAHTAKKNVTQVVTQVKKMSNNQKLGNSSELKVGDRVTLLDPVHERAGQIGTIKYFSAWDPAVCWDVDSKVEISHKAVDLKLVEE